MARQELQRFERDSSRRRQSLNDAPLAETMSVLGVPMMTKKSFMATEKALGRAWWEALEESMKEAAEEEKRNAIEQGSLHEGVRNPCHC